jgi:hypothetical protein
MVGICPDNFNNDFIFRRGAMQCAHFRPGVQTFTIRKILSFINMLLKDIISPQHLVVIIN